MTVEKAIEVLEERLAEYKRRIEDDPDNWQQWIDQAYGFMQGMGTAVDVPYEVWAADNWNDWYMSIHPAYR